MVMEENTLSSADPISPYYIDTANIVAFTDAVGDSNVTVTRDPHWYVDMQSTNANNITGYVHAYSEFDHGLIIYNGLDVDYNSNQWLRKIWVLELKQPWDPSGLPHAEAIVGQSSIQARPTSTPADGVSVITATVTIRDANGNRVPGQKARLISSRGTLDTFSASTGTTDFNGRFATTVRSSTPGTTVITAKNLKSGQSIAGSASVTFIPLSGQLAPAPANQGPIAIAGVNSELPLSGWYPLINSPSLQSIFGNAFRNSIDVAIDWRGSAPGHVDFIVNGSVNSVPADSRGASYVLDMGRDLRQGTNPLRIIAYNSAGQPSQAMDYAPVVWPVPAWLADLLNIGSTSGPSAYSLTEAGAPKETVTSPRGEYAPLILPSLEIERQIQPPAIIIWEKIPPKELMSKVNLPVGNIETKGLQIFTRLEIPLDSAQDAELRGGARYLKDVDRHRAAGYAHRGLSIFGTEVTGGAYLFGRARFDVLFLRPGTIGGGAEMEVSQEWERSWLALLYLLGLPDPTPVLENLPVVGEPVTDFVTRIAKGYLKISGRAGAQLGYQVYPIPQYDYLDFTLGASAETGLKAEIGVASINGSYGVDWDSTLLCLRNAVESGLTSNLFCDMTLQGGGRMEVKTLWWTVPVLEFASFQKSWPDASSSLAYVNGPSSKPARDWQLIGHVADADSSRFYGGPGRPQAFGPSSTAPRLPSLTAPSTITSVLVSNVYTYTEPSLAVNPADDSALLTWVHDDSTKPVGQSQEIFFSRWNGSSWTVPAGVTNDNQLDGAPQVAWANDGTAIAVWQRLSDTLPVTATLDATTANKIEIATAVYSPALGTWSPVGLLTNNTALDATPRLARSGDGKLLTVWRQNSGGLMGGAYSPDRIMAAFYDGVWTTPTVAVDNVPGLVDLDVGYGNRAATIAYTRNLTPTGSVTPTLQLFASEWNGSAWSPPVQVTDDGVGHRNQRVIYNAANQPVIVWLAGNELRLWNIASGNTASLTLDCGQTIDELRVAQDSAGNILAVFTAQRGQRDLFVAYYDETNNVWGRPRQLTDDGANEGYPAPSADSTGRLKMAYVSTGINYITSTATITGTAKPITYPLPVEGRTDLLTLTREFVRDLKIADGGFAFSNDHPLPGSSVVLSATVLNSGDLPVNGVTTAFYDGNPWSGGTLISSATQTQTLAAGFSSTFTTTYSVPATGGQRSLWAIVDPYNQIAEADEANNTTPMPAFGPDLAVQNAFAEQWVGHELGFATQIKNIGTTLAPTSTLSFYQEAITGSLLLTDIVPPLAPGTVVTLTTPWTYGGLPQGDYRVAAVINRDQIDFTETFTTNNSVDLSFGVWPDLAVSPLYFWTDRQPDGSLAITGTVYNFGSVGATNVVAAVYANDPLASTSRLFSVTIPSLAPAGSATITGTWNAPSSGYSLYLSADPDRMITETTRTNNLASVSDDFDLALQPTPGTIIRGATNVYTLTVSSRNGFSAPVTLTATSSAPGIAYIFGAINVTPTASFPLTITTDATTPEGSYPLFVQAVGGSLTHTLAITLNVVVPDFALRVVPSTPQTVVQGGSVTWEVGVAPYNGFALPVSLTVAGLPAATSFVLASNPVTPTVISAITVSTSITAAAGTYPVTAIGSSGSITRTAPLTLTVIPATRDLFVSKTMIGSNLLAGADVQYRIYYSASGNSPASDVIITDTLPASLTYISNANSAAFTTVLTGSTVIWTKPYVSPGEYGYLYLTAHLTDTAAAGTILTNVVQVANNRPETSYANNVYTDTHTVVPSTRDLAVSTGINSGTAVAGNQIQYWIYLANQGNADAANIVVTDTLPIFTTYVSDSNPYGFTTVVTGSTVVWTKPAMPAGTGAYLYLTAGISQDVAAGARITNTTSVSTSDQDVNQSNNVYTFTLTALAPSRDLAVDTWLDGGSPTPGNSLRYGVSYQNLGNAPADDVVITDTLPLSTTYLSYSGPISPTVSGNQVVWNVGRVPSYGSSGYDGYLYVTAQLSEEAPIGAALTNTAVITSSSLETSYSNNSDTQVNTVRAGVSYVYLSKSLEGYNLFQGAEATYRLQYGNSASDAATNVVLTDTLPEGMTFVRSTGVVSPTVAGNDVVWNLRTLPGYSSDNVYLTVFVTDSLPLGTVLTNTAVISASNDSYLPDNRSSAAHSLNAATRDLYVQKWLSGGSPLSGTTITYTIYYQNYGNAAAQDVVITDTLPPSVTLVSSGPFSPTVAGNVLAWNLGSVSGQGLPGYYGYLYAGVHIPATVPAGTVISNTAVIITSSPETGFSSNIATDYRTVLANEVDLQVAKSTCSGNPIPGSDVCYSIDFSNQGGITANNALVTDTLPSGTEFITATRWGWAFPPLSTSGNTPVWSVGSVPPLSYNGAIVVQARLTDTIPAGSVLTNTVSITGDGYEPNTANNRATAVLTVTNPAYDLYVSKGLASGVPAAGEVVTYSISFGNSGPTAATNVLISDVLPLATTFVTATRGWANVPFPPTTVSGNHLTWNVGTLSPWAYQDAIQVVVRLSDTLLPGDWLTNTAEVTTTSGGETNPYNNRSSDSRQVLARGVDLSVTKSTYQSAAPGGTIGYNISYRNDRADPASNVAITDVLPAGLSVDSVGYSWPWSVVTGTNTITWTRSAVAGGESGWLYFTARMDDDVPEGTVLSNTVAIGSASVDGVPSNDLYTHPITVIPPIRNVFVSKWLNGGAPAAGRAVTYTINYGNSYYTTAPTHDVVLSDTLPQAATFITATRWGMPFPPSLHNDKQLVWNLGTLNGNYGYSLDVQVRLTDTLVSGTLITNTVEIATSDAETDYTDNRHAYERTVLARGVDLSVTKSTYQSAAPGGTIGY
ncbi:MAG: Ig-like domain-containing protein, partial [Actinobacteria bacterium]|nr:Ig-like domain-containing protein [Actinomycetota bacterium]